VALRLYNTLTRGKEDFAPLDPENVRMYVCGPTVYDRAHIGNARPVVVFDVLYRLLRHHFGAEHVTYVRNITDVDDKIIDAAREDHELIEELTRRTTEDFHADMKALGALPPDFEPRATEHVPEMIAMIGRLIERGHAYEAEGHVLFHVPSWPDYGRLSRNNPDEIIAGARVEVAPYKKDPADFVLWKPSAPDLPGWESPWGRGRPGWHIECSAMSEALLGESFDIHGGGQDLVFPHHENEIAQSTCAHAGAPMARYWVHNGYLVVEGEKMSKSLGNFFTVRELLDEGWDGEVIRLALLKTHYRQPLDFSRAGLKEAKAELDRFYTGLREVADVAAEDRPAPEDFVAALDDDLNTPLAMTRMHEITTELNKATGKAAQTALKGDLVSARDLLGLAQRDPEDWFKHVLPVHARVASEAEIESLIARREAARKARDFAEADRIRESLKESGVFLEDRPDGTTDWRRAG